jgi:hypothetical protein
MAIFLPSAIQIGTSVNVMNRSHDHTCIYPIPFKRMPNLIGSFKQTLIPCHYKSKINISANWDALWTWNDSFWDWNDWKLSIREVWDLYIHSCRKFQYFSFRIWLVSTYWNVAISRQWKHSRTYEQARKAISIHSPCPPNRSMIIHIQLGQIIVPVLSPIATRAMVNFILNGPPVRQNHVTYSSLQIKAYFFIQWTWLEMYWKQRRMEQKKKSADCRLVHNFSVFRLTGNNLTAYC